MEATLGILNNGLSEWIGKAGAAEKRGRDVASGRKGDP